MGANRVIALLKSYRDKERDGSQDLTIVLSQIDERRAKNDRPAYPNHLPHHYFWCLVDTKVRLALGEKALRPALQVIIGKSIRTVQRYLNEGEEKSTTDVMLFYSIKALSDLRASLAKWRKAHGKSKDEVVQSIDQDVTLLLDQLTKIDT
jgi:hypothetical protein